MSNFPNFDFKINCGDDPAVRQWLHDNGVTRPDGSSPTTYGGQSLYLYITGLCVCSGVVKDVFYNHSLPHINPYDYIQPTVAERMAALIEQYKADIPEWARFVVVTESGDLVATSHEPYLTEEGWFSETKTKCKTLDTFVNDADWSETLTELQRCAPVEPQDHQPTGDEAPLFDDDTDSCAADNRAEIAARDDREMSRFELDYIVRKTIPATAKPNPKQLTIPSTCLRDQAMPMMLGGDFGGLE